MARAAAAEAAAAAEGEAAGGTDLMSLAFTETGEFVKGVRGKEQVAEEEAELPSTKFKEYGGFGSNLRVAATPLDPPPTSLTLHSSLPLQVPGGGRARGDRGRRRGGGASLGTGAAEGAEGEGGAGGFVDGDEEPEEAAAAAADGDEEEEEDDDDDGDELGYLHETTTQGGLAGALEMARGRGMLGADGPTSGRMFDQKGAGLHDYEADDGDGEGKAGYEGTRLGRGEHTQRTAPPSSHTPLPRIPHSSRPRFELNYFDEYGRKMTQKQAFRQLSWKFHGKGPSKKRREKRMQVTGRPATATAPFAAARLPSHPRPARSLVRTWSARWTSHRRTALWTTWVPPARPAVVEVGARRPLRHQRDPPRRRRRRAAGGGGAERAKKKAKKGGLAGGFNTG